MKVDYIISNKFTEEAFKKIVYKWLAEGEYTPDDILENMTETYTEAQIPVFRFQSSYQGICSASVGYNKLEDYYETDNHGKQIRKTRTVIVWTPYSQPVNGAMVNLVYTGGDRWAGLTSFVEQMGWGAEDLRTISEYDSQKLQLDTLFKYSPAVAWDKLGQQKAYDIAFKNAGKGLPGQFSMNVNLNVTFSDISNISVVTPYWVCNYQYRGKKYFVALDGNSHGRIYGQRPEDHAKRRHVSRLRWFHWICGTLASLFAVYFFSNDSIEDLKINWPNVGVFAACFILSWIVTEREIKYLKERSKSRRLTTLKHKLIQND